MVRAVVYIPICVGGFSVDCGFNGEEWVWSGYLEGMSICSWEFYGEIDVWIIVGGVLLKFVDLIFTDGTVEIINIPEPPLD